MLDRRQFLATLATTVATTLALPRLGAASNRPRDLLVLGGTGFLGPHTVRYALERGHRVTLFNRGRTNPELFVDLEQLRGDRDGDLAALEGRRWDAVIDTSGYVPRLVGDSARLLADSVDHYVFISTISVYADLGQPDMDETAPLATLADPTVEQVNGETYGGLKALCEQAAETAMPGRVTVIRPGLIAGPGDRTDRFTYWPVRVARGGDVLSPGPAEAHTQFIDARDLGQFIVQVIEDRILGIFNADRPARSLSMGDMLAACRTAAGSDARFHWAPPEWLAKNGVQPWSDMPAWFPDSGDFAALGEISTARAAAAGLVIRPVVETARDTLEWFRTLPAERQSALKAGLSAEREAELIERLKPS